MKFCCLLPVCLFFLLKNVSGQDYKNLNKTIVIHGPKIFDVDAKTAGTPIRVRRQSTEVPDSEKFDQFAKEQIAKAIYPRPTNFLDKTVDGKLLVSHYGCEVGKPSGSYPFTPLTRSYKNCEILKLEAKWDRGQSQGCNSNNKCSKKFTSKISTSEKSTSSWKVGGKLTSKTLGLDISAEYGQSRESSITHENTVEDSVTLNPGEVGIPLVIVAGVKCDVEVRAVLSSHVGKLNSDGLKTSDEVSCSKKDCPLSCTDFLTGDFNFGDQHWYSVKRECLYFPSKREIWPVSVPFEACKANPDKVFEEKNVIMPLLGEDGNVVKIKYIYVQV